MPPLMKRCFNFNLRNGTIITGVISLISSLVYVITISMLTAYHYNFATIAPNIMLISANGLASGFLIYGAIKRNIFFLMPFIAFGSVGIITTFILMINGAASISANIYNSYYDRSSEFYQIPLFIIGMMIVIVLMVFMMAIVVKYYKSLSQEILQEKGLGKKPSFASISWPNVEAAQLKTNDDKVYDDK